MSGQYLACAHGIRGLGPACRACEIDYWRRRRDEGLDQARRAEKRLADLNSPLATHSPGIPYARSASYSGGSSLAISFDTPYIDSAMTQRILAILQGEFRERG